MPCAGLSTAEVDHFVRDGYAAVRGAVPADAVAEVRAAAGALVPAGFEGPWWLGRSSVYDIPALVEALAAPVRAAFDALAGPGRWHLGGDWGFPTRLPGAAPAVWHIDGDWFTHHVTSGEQVLTPIFLWGDVGPDDGPTLLCRGSHRAVTRILSDAEPDGVAGADVGTHVHERLRIGDVVAATGAAGDVIVCHPFLAHAINPFGPARPRFISNVAVHGYARLNPSAEPGELSPVEAAIAQGLAGVP